MWDNAQLVNVVTQASQPSSSVAGGTVLHQLSTTFCTLSLRKRHICKNLFLNSAITNPTSYISWPLNTNIKSATPNSWSWRAPIKYSAKAAVPRANSWILKCWETCTKLYYGGGQSLTPLSYTPSQTNSYLAYHNLWLSGGGGTGL